jgi:branched-subunit amino acid transport protein
MSQGQLITSWADARLFGAAAAVVWYVWRRDMLSTIIVGTGVMLMLRLGLGW